MVIHGQDLLFPAPSAEIESPGEDQIDQASLLGERDVLLSKLPAPPRINEMIKTGPGDSLLFGLGAFAANPLLKGPLEVEMLFITLSIAAIAGDTANYSIGNYIGPRVFHDGKYRFLKREYLERTHRFYEKHGGKTIVIARFIPIIRTFAPFVAGIGEMTYPRFISYNVVGGIAWIGTFIFGGYFFGNLPMVRNNFTLVIIAIVILSVLPGVIEYLRQCRETT